MTIRNQITKLVCLLHVILIVRCQKPHTCESEIYCHGNLLHIIQMARLFSDSKTFVDMKLKHPPKQTIANFSQYIRNLNNTPTKRQVQHFVQTNFESAGRELEDWRPEDWKPNPEFLEKIQDARFREWAAELNFMWRTLGRRIKPEVRTNGKLYSIIWIPNPVIVPGGRFREYYYWDSYWILKGILHCEMHQTALGMLRNFQYLVNKLGLIPNGGRIYYKQRSQPPLFIPMVKLYVDHTGDYNFINESILAMEKEFNYWMNNRVKTIKANGKEYRLAVYGGESLGPRPESYREDIRAAEALEKEKKQELYGNLKAACESGMDFSSRWFVFQGTNKGNLSNIKTRSIVPVDLNSYLRMNAKILSDFNRHLNNTIKTDLYLNISNQFQESITELLWHEDLGIWLDYDIINSKRRDYYSLSNLIPLWTKSYDQARSSEIADMVLEYLNRNKALEFEGGIPTTMEETGEQWDFPSAWPPFHHMIIEGLENTGSKPAQEAAYRIAVKWINANYIGYMRSHIMFEKYDATEEGAYGTGGEYPVQAGFGWTNGIILDLLIKYGPSLSSSADNVFNSTSTWFTFVIVVLFIFNG